MLALIFALLQAAVQPELPGQWGQFSRAGALSHVSETVEIATGDRINRTEFRYILRLTTTKLGANPEIAWADSAKCPAVRAVIASMRDIRMPIPAPPGVPGEALTLTLDGAGYTLRAPSSDNMGQIMLKSNVGTPLAAWVNWSLEQLAPCWSAAAPAL